MVHNLVTGFTFHVIDSLWCNVLAQQLSKTQQSLSFLFWEVECDAVKLVDSHNWLVAAARAHKLTADGATKRWRNFLCDLFTPNRDSTRAAGESIKGPVGSTISLTESITIAHWSVSWPCWSASGSWDNRRRRILQRIVLVIVIVKKRMVDGLVFVDSRLVWLRRLCFRPKIEATLAPQWWSTKDGYLKSLMLEDSLYSSLSNSVNIAEEGRACRGCEMAVMSPRASEMQPIFFGVFDSSSIDVSMTCRSSCTSFSPSGITQPRELSALMTGAGLLGSVLIVGCVPLMQSSIIWSDEMRDFLFIGSWSWSQVRNWGLEAMACSNEFKKQVFPKLIRPEICPRRCLQKKNR